MPEKIKWGIKSGAAVAAFLISDVLFTEIYALFLMRLNLEERWITLCFEMGSSLITLLLAFPVFVLVMGVWGKLQTFHIKATEPLSVWGYLAYAALAALPMALLWGMELVLFWQGGLWAEDINSLMPESWTNTVLFSCLLLPVMEEMMFRGILLHKLLPLGTGYAIWLTTCFFVIIHYNNPVNMILSFAAGFALAHMTARVKGILPAVLFHIGINFLGQAIFPLYIALA